MFDVLIQNGLIYDGTGAEPFRADIGIRGDRIVRIAPGLTPEGAGRVIDAAGKCVTPGFIDPHTHVDMSVLYAPAMEPYLRQGVTTVVTGNCGHAPAPMGPEVFRGPVLQFDIQHSPGTGYFELFSFMLPKKEAAQAVRQLYGIEADWDSLDSFLRKCSQQPLGCNMAPLIGYNAVRNAVMGMDCRREATAAELDAMAALVEDGMCAGAFGLSTGRDPNYVPGPYATMDEMTRMLRIVARHGGIFASHTYNRNSSGQVDRLGGYEEMLQLGRASGVRLNISHVHTMGMADSESGAMAAVEKTLDLFERAEREGLDLSYDVIPDPLSADFTAPYFAYWLKPFVLMSGSRARLAENFRMADFRDMVRRVIDGGMYPILTELLGELRIVRHREAQFVGKTFLDWAEQWQMQPLDAMMRIFSRDPDMGADLVIGGSARVVDALCSHRMAMPCSDGLSYSRQTNVTGNPELPVYSNATTVSFIPRFLTRQGKECFADAVHRASGFVARRFGIEGRGVIREGNYADLVVLDRTALRSFEEDAQPLQDPQGFLQVLVNGRIAFDCGTVTPGAGQVLRRGSV